MGGGALRPGGIGTGIVVSVPCNVNVRCFLSSRCLRTHFLWFDDDFFSQELSEKRCPQEPVVNNCGM